MKDAHDNVRNWSAKLQLLHMNDAICQAHATSSHIIKTYWSGNVEARQDVPCWNEGEQHCGGNLKVR